ncbi:AAA family ATPase [Oligella sp. HMSC09E12]|uniref:AAA family ATPase n=1 Tax=Oligella sp. HMSC09E12 TaxID=1581147 RepID=UPI0008A55545|nr:SMC family ATPase [Oligella sp. HMSC09E12]OFV49742.1 hypothetical protein HMPREF3179_03790 [Oligella sp. HMSC09E12]
MITKISMTNFRKHENTEIAFTPSLNVIRGSNEKGKSTVGEALLYVLYGSKSLRGRFDDVVTWGKPTTTLKVEVCLLIQDVLFKFVRSKGGAEIYKGDDNVPFITGQTEVSDYASKLIGADAVTARKLMFANQGNMRGTLEAGPKATAEMVEELSDFSFFEDLLEAMSQKLVLGSNVIAKSRLEESKANLEALLSSQENKDDQLKSAMSQVSEAEGKLTGVSANLGELKLKYDKAQLDLELYEERKVQYTNAKEAVESATEAYNNRLLAIDQARSCIVDVDTSNLDYLKERIQKADEAKVRYLAYVKFTNFSESFDKRPTTFQGSMDALEAAIEKSQLKVKDIDNLITKKVSQINELKRRIIKDTTCSHCGQPIKNVEEVLANNKKFESEVEDESNNLSTLEKSLEEARLELKNLQDIKKSNQPVELYLRTDSSYVDVNYSVVPYEVKWKGEVPNANENVDEIKEQVKEIERQVKLVEEAKTRLEVLTETALPLEQALAKATKTLADSSFVDTGEALKKAFEDVEYDYLAVDMEKATLEHTITTNKEIISVIKSEQEAFKARTLELQRQVDSFEKEVNDLAFNNALLKKVREARPMVANQLWNLVLSSVSTMFSKVRGVKSTVTKSKEGFLVNGESVDGLSGSTLDLLGLAIRCSLIKLFIPNCPFLILDEPAAAMDIDRTASMMGFISSLDFPQILLITHEDLSETLASNLIEI